MNSILLPLFGLLATASSIFIQYPVLPLQKKLHSPPPYFGVGVLSAVPSFHHTIKYMREGLATRSEYTANLNHFDNAYSEIKNHIQLPENNMTKVLAASGHNNPFAQYVMLIYTVDHLVDAMDKEGRVWFKENYFKLLTTAIMKAMRNPIEAVESIRLKLDATKSQFALLRDVVNRLQSTCKIPVSLECDVIIDSDILASSNQKKSLLQRQALHLQAVGEVMKLFLTDYAPKFDHLAHSNGAQTFLINGYDVLWPLVSACAHARSLVSSLNKE